MEDDNVEEALRETGYVINYILQELARVPRMRAAVLEDGRELLRGVHEAGQLHALGKSINQLARDPPGSFSWDGKFGSWIFTILRMERNRKECFNALREEIKRVDMTFIDRLRALGKSPEMTDKPHGPAKRIEVATVIVPDVREVPDEEKIDCRVCGRKYASEKAYNTHVRNSHPGESDRWVG